MWFFKKKKIKKIDWIIAGLGNPGKKYAKNRHNIGWMVAMTYADKHKVPLLDISSAYLEANFTLNDKNILIALPTTFMNNSGEALKQLQNKYNIPIENIIVIVDEINFPLGKLHLKNGGGDGGHNGISSIIQELNSNLFYRLRCGIDKNFPQGGLVDYVLSDFNDDEIELRDKMILNAVKSLDFTIINGAAKSQSYINSASLWKEESE
ncbi:MAG: aminoacyl-tRNA hydrolase [Chlorobi bacterium]|nr:aminoacyl-tRNA hydrolase [Chlorobiota bacterium]